MSLKGRVACEMNTCDELLATEVLFMNILEPLNPPEIAALLSAFVFQVGLSAESLSLSKPQHYIHV